MDAFLQPLVAAFLSEWGDRTQLLVMMLAFRFNATPRLLIGIGLAALLNAALAAFGGFLIVDLLTFRAQTLMTGLALILAGGAAMLPQKPPKLIAHAGYGAILTSFVAFFIIELGDKTQFVTMALAARSHGFALAAIGAATGVLLANVPAVLLGSRLPTILPLRTIRIGAGIILLTIGTLAVIDALAIG